MRIAADDGADQRRERTKKGVSENNQDANSVLNTKVGSNHVRAIAGRLKRDARINGAPLDVIRRLIRCYVPPRAL